LRQELEQLGWIVSRNLQIDYRYGRALVNRSSRFWRDSAPDNTPDLLEARALLKSRESERLSRTRRDRGEVSSVPTAIGVIVGR